MDKCKWCKKVIRSTYHGCDYVSIRNELYCPHGVGHGPHVHGCDGCCSKDDWKAAWKMYRG